MDIQKKLSEARIALASANALLADRRTAYVDGSGKEYQTVLDHQAELREKIAAHQAEARDAEAKFKKLFAAANHVRTAAVKSALHEKNDALSLVEELQAALDTSLASSQELMLRASHEGSGYAGAYRASALAFARCETLQLMAEHGPALARAMATLHSCAHRAGESNLSGDPMWNGVLRDLNAMAAAVPHDQELPLPASFGALDLGPFADRPFVSPSAASLMRRAQACEMEQTAAE